MAAVQKQNMVHIDDEQPKNVEDHYKLIMSDTSYIDSKPSKVSPEDLPDWFDEKLFKMAQDYNYRNYLSFNVGYLAGLIAVFLVPSISDILQFTKQSTTPCAAFKRYFQTILHVSNLHSHDPKDPESKFYKTLNTIRWKHSITSKRSMDNNEGGISQKDMVLTQFGFIGYILVMPEVIGLTDGKEEREAINHFWRVVGHLLGIPNRLNLCRKNESETTELCQKISDEVYKCHLENPPEIFLQMTKVTLDGIACLDPIVNFDSFLAFFYEINGSKYEKKISYYSKFNLMFRKSIFYCFKIPIIGCIVRAIWNGYLRTAYKIYENYPVIAWMKYGKQDTKINLYPHSF